MSCSIMRLDRRWKPVSVADSVKGDPCHFLAQLAELFI